MKYYLPNLPYQYHELEPYIDEMTMMIHHQKHHQAYIDKLNSALENYPELQKKSLESLLLEDLPEEIKSTVINNGGGHYNHSLFWEILGPKKELPDNDIINAIKKQFSSLENFQDEFTKVALNRFGSGWAWLIVKNGKLKILSTANQDTPLKEGKIILALDVWEHAYYLNYQNRRNDYIKAFFNIINWDKVNELYLKN
ncbi:MAG TPA: superoxide dismutase [Bacilli bacterium]